VYEGGDHHGPKDAEYKAYHVEKRAFQASLLLLSIGHHDGEDRYRDVRNDDNIRKVHDRLPLQ
jgi:hypothetical protein